MDDLSPVQALLAFFKTLIPVVVGLTAILIGLFAVLIGGLRIFQMVFNR